MGDEFLPGPKGSGSPTEPGEGFASVVEGHRIEAHGLIQTFLGLAVKGLEET